MRYHVHNHQTGGCYEVLPPISSLFGPATSPVDWPRVMGNTPAPYHPSPGVTSMPPPPPPGLIHPGSFTQTPTTPPQSHSSTEGHVLPSSVTLSGTDTDLLQVAASSTSLLCWRKRKMRELRVNQSLFAKKSNVAATVHLNFLVQHFPVTTSSVKYSQQWD